MHQLTLWRGTPCKRANICSTVQQIPYLLQNLKVCYHDHIFLSLSPALSYITPINTLITNLKCFFILSCQPCWTPSRDFFPSPIINPLKPNYLHMRRTTQLTFRAAFYIFIQQIYVLNILKRCIISVFFSSKCRLFCNVTFFGSCIIHILNTGVLKFKCKIPAPKG